MVSAQADDKPVAAQLFHPKIGFVNRESHKGSMNFAAHNLIREVRGIGVLRLNDAGGKDLAMEFAGCVEQLLVYKCPVSEA